MIDRREEAAMSARGALSNRILFRFPPHLNTIHATRGMSSSRHPRISGSRIVGQSLGVQAFQSLTVELNTARSFSLTPSSFVTQGQLFD